MTFSNLSFMGIGDGSEEVRSRPTRWSLEAKFLEIGSSFLSGTKIETLAFVQDDYLVEEVV